MTENITYPHTRVVINRVRINRVRPIVSFLCKILRHFDPLCDVVATLYAGGEDVGRCVRHLCHLLAAEHHLSHPQHIRHGRKRGASGIPEQRAKKTSSL